MDQATRSVALGVCEEVHKLLHSTDVATVETASQLKKYLTILNACITAHHDSCVAKHNAKAMMEFTNHKVSYDEIEEARKHAHI